MSATRRIGDWQEAGRGWGARAVEWAYLFEPYSRPANDLLLDELEVGPGTRYLDVACGSGLAANAGARRGATVTGLDAAEALIDIARARTPGADFRVGDMFDLPFDDGSFDVVTSFNGIWNRCEDALQEVRRVLRPGGRVGLTFFGAQERLGLRPFFITILKASPPSHQEATLHMGETDQFMAEMLRATHFEVESKGTVDVHNEWPDIDTAVRALAASGPSVPAIEALGYDEYCDRLRVAIAPLAHPQLGLRITSELGWMTAHPR